MTSRTIAIWVIVFIAIIILAYVVFFTGWILFPDNKIEVATTTSSTGSVLNDLEASSATSTAKPTNRSFSINAGPKTFSPNIVTVNRGDLVELRLNNMGGTYNFTIDQFNISQTLPPGETIIRFTPEQKGNFEFYSALQGQKQLGMVGRFVVK